MRIIGHRGAAGLALENTLSSVALAKLLGVDFIEIDVRLTKDNKLVVCHDADLSRISHSSKKINTLMSKEFKDIPLYDVESRVPLLGEVLEQVGDTPVIIEIKDKGSASRLLDVLGKFPQAKIIVASFKLDELTTLHELDPKLKIYNLERSHAVEAINMARIMGFDGVGLKFWLLNPFTYWLARRSGLELYVYTVNSKFLGKFLAALYPKAAICTDHPEWFTKPPKLVRSKRR